jgi:tetratricopeptide (TPR) repeat protein
MIVKDESHVIRRCLDSVMPLIDTWVIVDTGSTDGTQDVIRSHLAAAGKQGVLYERPFRDFGTNRTEALELARNRARYSFIIDADEVLSTSTGFALPNLTADAYQTLHRSGTTDTYFWLIQLVRNALPWRYEGVLHEALACVAPHRTERLEGFTIQGLFDSARNRLPREEKYMRDARVLEDALVREPNNSRYVFYLGQSYRDAGQYEKSLHAYARRAKMGGWEEEAWFAQYQFARNLERLQRRAEAIEAYLAAFQRRPSRAEPLYELARMLRESKDFQLAHLFADRARRIPRADDTLFVDESVYRWRCLDEYSVAAYWLGQFTECAEASRRLLTEGHLPAEHRNRIEKNLTFALDGLKKSVSV